MNVNRKTFIWFLAMSLCWVAGARAGSELIGDTNGDGRLTADDVDALRDYLIGRDTIWANGQAFVDLGLPSGTLWATCNVGAQIPEENGYYFSWGETEPKEDYSWDSYLWGNSETTLTRYCTDANYGTVDGESTLRPIDDAARQQLGGRWCVPTLAELRELYDYCIWDKDTVNTIPGWRLSNFITHTNIFIPNSGFRSDDLICNEGLEFLLWANSTFPNNSSVAYGFFVGDHYKGWAYRNRYLGYPIRPVLRGTPADAYDVNQDGHVSLADLTTLVNLIVQQ